MKGWIANARDFAYPGFLTSLAIRLLVGRALSQPAHQHPAALLQPATLGHPCRQSNFDAQNRLLLAEYRRHDRLLLAPKDLSGLQVATLPKYAPHPQDARHLVYFAVH